MNEKSWPRKNIISNNTHVLNGLPKLWHCTDRFITSEKRAFRQINPADWQTDGSLHSVASIDMVRIGPDSINNLPPLYVFPVEIRTYFRWSWEKIFIEIRSSHDTFSRMEFPKPQINPPHSLFCINFICCLVVLCLVCFLVTSNTFVN